MAIKPAFQIIKKAVIDNLNKGDPDKVVFFVGMKPYKARDIIDHFTKETVFASELINSAVKVNSIGTLGNPHVPDEVIEATVKMFK